MSNAKDIPTKKVPLHIDNPNSRILVQINSTLGQEVCISEVIDKSSTYHKALLNVDSLLKGHIQQHKIIARNRFPATDLRRRWIIDCSSPVHMATL